MKHVKVFGGNDREVESLLDTQIGPKQYRDDYCWYLCKLDDQGIPIDVLGWDGGEPEDQVLVRDWNWVPKLVEELYEEIDKKQQEIAELTEKITEMKEYYL